MIPNNTHHDTLGVYYDFLEDSGFDTEELRDNNIHHNWEFSICVETVGTHSANYFSLDIVGSGIMDNDVGGNLELEDGPGTEFTGFTDEYYGNGVGSNL